MEEDSQQEPVEQPGDPRAERHQQVRRKQIVTALMVYISAMLPFAFINHLGMLQLTTDLKILAVIGAILTNAIFYALVRSNINLYFRDPSMTFPQVLIACAWATLAAWNMDQAARLFPVTLFLLAFLFGIYTLKTRQFLLLSLIVTLAYFSVVIREYVLSNGGRAFDIELMHAIVLASGLVWMSLVGGYVSSLRRRLAAQRRELSAVAFIDPLTDLNNRRYVDEVMLREFARIERDKVETLSIALLDLDQFKLINDQHGHLAGDDALRQVAEALRSEMRIMDTVGRYGGDEFIVVLPDTPERGAEVAMERLRRRIEGSPGPAVGAIITLSIGIAEHRKGDSVEKLRRRADEALYVAKHMGRNRVCKSSDVGASAIQPERGAGR